MSPKFQSGDTVCLAAVPKRVYQVISVADSSHLDPNIRTYDPPYFYELRGLGGGVAHWPESCLDAVVAPNPWMRDHLEDVYRNIRDRYPPERAEEMIKTLREGIPC